MDRAIHRINHYPADTYYENQLRYPPFKQLGPDIYVCFTIVPEGPPINVTGTSFSTTSINLDWLPVSEELRNGIIRKYEAYIYGANGYNEQMTVQAPTRTAVFQGLVIFSNYSLKVRAFTRKGPGPWSSLINTTTSAGGMFLVASCLNFCRPAVRYTLAQLFEGKFRIIVFLV